MQKEYLIKQMSTHLDDNDFKAVLEPLHNGWITEGPKSEEFIKKLKELIGVKYGVLAPNGTLALCLSMIALGIGPGDEVIVPDITFIGSATSIIFSGATPIFADVERDTFQIDIKNIEKLITKKTKAIMPVHLYGTACDMDEILNLAKKHNLLIIEDAAQAIGVMYRNKHAGSFGSVGCFSFFADKTITTGEGGFIATNDEQIFNKLCLLRNQGRINRGSFIHPAIGYNFRMTDIQASLGLSQLAKLDSIILNKQKLFDAYQSELKGLQGVRLLGASKNSNHVPFRAVIIAEKAFELMSYLEAENVQTRSFFFPLHKQPCFTELVAPHHEYFNDLSFPNANFGYGHGICLPIHCSLTLEDINYISNKIIAFYSKMKC